MICERRVRATGKGLQNTSVRPAMVSGLEMVALCQRQEAELEVTEVKMLRFSLGVTSTSEGQLRLSGLKMERKRLPNRKK